MGRRGYAGETGRTGTGRTATQSPATVAERITGELRERRATS
jgi:hypothetical protein